jgi:hypothetical protein
MLAGGQTACAKQQMAQRSAAEDNFKEDTKTIAEASKRMILEFSRTLAAAAATRYWMRSPTAQRGQYSAIFRCQEPQPSSSSRKS